MHKILTIAGSDSCGGAGVQADLKTITALGAYGTCVITAVTAQNTVGVSSIHEVPAVFVGQQIDAVISDMGADAVKTGMLTNEEVVEVVSDRIRMHNLKNLVVDPVIMSHKGERLLTAAGVKKLSSLLVPLSHLITPNIPEAEVLAASRIMSLSDMKDAAKSICESGARNVLIKGGHVNEYGKYRDDGLDRGVVDILYDGNSFEHFEGEKIMAEKVHGTGCIYSAAIATELAKGNDLVSAITNAKKYITKIIKNPLTLGRGHKLGNIS